MKDGKMEKECRGSNYRIKWAGVFLTYLFVVSVKFEGVQVDMVIVRTIIKGLCR